MKVISKKIQKLNQFNPIKVLALFVIIGLLLRALLAFGFEATGDTGTWRLGGRTGVERTQLGMGNGTVYDGDCPTICSNWPPLTFHYMTMMRWIFTSFNPLQLPEPGFYKLLPFLADTGTIVMIYLLAKELRTKNGLLLAGIYAIHPVALYVAGYHGQRDTIWVFFSLLTIYYMLKNNSSSAGSFFALGSAIKIPSLLFSPFLFFKTKGLVNKIIFMVTAILFFTLLSSPELVIYFKTVMKQVFFYEGFKGWWGLSFFLQKIEFFTGREGLVESFATFHKSLLYSAIIISNIYFAINAKNLVVGILGILLSITIFSNPFASQYLIWVLPMILLLPSSYTKMKITYSLAALFMAINFYGFSFYVFSPIVLLTQKIFYNIEFFSYPMDTGIIVWIVDVILLSKIITDKNLMKNAE